MHRIVYLERDSIRAQVRRPSFVHTWVEYPATQAAEMPGRLAGASIAIVNKLVCDAALLDQLPALQLIAVAATGTNNIDIDACRSRGIAVCNIRGYAAQTVPEHALALMLALSRNLIAYRSSLQQGEWQQSSQFCLFSHPIRDLFGSTLALIGNGSLGQGLAQRARALGMRVLQVERRGVAVPRPGYTDFATALATADVVSLHCPLTPDTHHLIGAAELQLMPAHALLINTARGGLVDEVALASALRNGEIAGAGFDVLSSEPPAAGHPLVAPALLALPNFLLTPHVAWASSAAMQALADQLIDNIAAFAAGRRQNRLD